MKEKTLIFILFFVPITLMAFDADQLFQAANQAYRSENYKEAIRKYENLLDQGIFSAELYYNLGNSYYKEENIGRARLYYERALKILSGPDLSHNLQVVKLQLEDQINPLPEFFLLSWWRDLRRAANTDILAVLGVAWLWLGLFGLSLWLLNSRRKWKRSGFWAGISFLVLAIAFFSVAVLKAEHLRNYPYAVILAEEATLFSAPEDTSEGIMELHEGTKVKLLETLSDWQLVKLPNGEEGWLDKRVFEKI